MSLQCPICNEHCDTIRALECHVDSCIMLQRNEPIPNNNISIDHTCPICHCTFDNLEHATAHANECLDAAIDMQRTTDIEQKENDSNHNYNRIMPSNHPQNNHNRPLHMHDMNHNHNNRNMRSINIEHFEMEYPSYSRSRRNKWLCQYSTNGGNTIGIYSALGATKDVTDGVQILCQRLDESRSLLSVDKLGCLIVCIKTDKGKMIGFATLHVDSLTKVVTIDMFAVDNESQGHGFATVMICLIKHRLLLFEKRKYKLMVSAANDVVSFWNKHSFVQTNKKGLSEYQVKDQKDGQLTYLLWNMDDVENVEHTLVRLLSKQ
eukprot:194321_1